MSTWTRTTWVVRNDAIDVAYRAKYAGRYPVIVPSMLTPEARAATLDLVPR